MSPFGHEQMFNLVVTSYTTVLRGIYTEVMYGEAIPYYPFEKEVDISRKLIRRNTIFQ